MADVINRITKEFKRSVNTPDYPENEWIINPVMPKCEIKYLKIDGDSVLEMSVVEKEIVDLVPEKTEEQIKIEQDYLMESQIRDEYSMHEERRIINLGIQDKTNEEYVAYLAFIASLDTSGEVSQVKEVN